MAETFEDRTDRRLRQIETTLHTLDERTASLPALMERLEQNQRAALADIRRAVDRSNNGVRLDVSELRTEVAGLRVDVGNAIDAIADHAGDMGKHRG